VLQSFDSEIYLEIDFHVFANGANESSILPRLKSNTELSRFSNYSILDSEMAQHVRAVLIFLLSTSYTALGKQKDRDRERYV